VSYTTTLAAAPFLNVFYAIILNNTDCSSASYVDLSMIASLEWQIREMRLKLSKRLTEKTAKVSTHPLKLGTW
jgi:hypothetical protein